MNFGPYFFAGGGGVTASDVDAQIAAATAGPIQTNIDASVAVAISSIIGTATALGDTLGELQALIATNTTNIATNATNIATNTADIATNVTNIGLKVAKAGDTMTGTLTMALADINSYNNNGGVQFVNSVYVTASTGATFRCQKARGTFASPTVIAQNDNIASYAGRGYDGAAFKNVGDFNYLVVAATPSSTDMEARWRLLLCPAASVTLTEIVRADHATGLSMFGANPVIDTSRHFRLRAYTVATLPTAAPAGQYAKITDGAAAPVFNAVPTGGGTLHIPVTSDGTNWRYG